MSSRRFGSPLPSLHRGSEVAGVRYVISYDLGDPSAKYQPPYDAVSSVGAKRVLPSQWVVRWHQTSADNIRLYLQRYLGVNDRLLVSSLDSGDWAGFHLMSNPDSI